MSGLGAPERTATPRPTRAMLVVGSGRELRLSGGVLQHLPRTTPRSNGPPVVASLISSGVVPKRKTSLWPDVLSNCAASSRNGPVMAPPAKIWSSAACTLAIGDRTRPGPASRRQPSAKTSSWHPPECGAAHALRLRLIHLDHLHHAEFLVIHHVAVEDEAPGEIEEARAEGRRCPSAAPSPCRANPRSASFSPLIATIWKGLVWMWKTWSSSSLVDDGPFLDRTERNALVDAIRVERAAADEEAEFLVVGGRRKFGLVDRQRQAPRVGDLLIADGRERRSRRARRAARIGSGSPSTTTWASGPTGDG